MDYCGPLDRQFKRMARSRSASTWAPTSWPNWLSFGTNTRSLATSVGKACRSVWRWWKTRWVECVCLFVFFVFSSSHAGITCWNFKVPLGPRFSRAPINHQLELQWPSVPAKKVDDLSCGATSAQLLSYVSEQTRERQKPREYKSVTIKIEQIICLTIFNTDFRVQLSKCFITSWKVLIITCIVRHTPHCVCVLQASREPLPPDAMNEIFEDVKDMGVLIGKGGIYGQVIK